MTEKPSIDEVRALEKFISYDGSATLLRTFQGILRSQEKMRAALSTPPADDVREALAAIVKRTSQAFGGPSLAEFANDPPTRKHYATADAIRAAFEVRPHGTVTDAADVDSRLRAALAVYLDLRTVARVMADLEAAREVHP
ncbi:hypothetical protein J2X55_002284 [Microbacterium sp. 1154]|uniref:hypothetical protein n=1 Tax=Microbacterium sp. 1154 TaxID=2817733 RepID=UPI002854FEE0|nr:hypothetical protein [Microbacterium sp. 1154]MDR6691372.1 hypothetical protein [Microbacterium sp. 1154]